ncbi:GNAT family N-acetyltransferase [Micromonospora sp. NPDC050276]|uniref:GNAT family N-acetyltransferase n=1 Tax=Micromonospora sp. NPDC050276 TaxID=3364278 RepID=UPI0037A6AE4B
MLSVTHSNGHLLSSDPARIDLDLVHHWLSTDAYWALGRDPEVTARAFAGSVPFGIYRPEDGRQVAVARVVTDGATFAWLCDVYVDRAARGRGLGGWLVTGVRDHLAELGVRRILLCTNDAHEVYARVGFTPLDVPQRWMQLDRRPPVTPITGKEQSGGTPLTVDA